GGSADVQVRAGEDLVDLEHVRPREHLLRRPARMRFGKRRALRPRDEVVERPPPRLHLVVALRIGILDPAAGLVAELERTGPVHLFAHEAGRATNELTPPLEAVLEVDLVPLAHRNAVRDDDHAASLHHGHRDATSHGRRTAPVIGTNATGQTRWVAIPSG